MNADHAPLLLPEGLDQGIRRALGIELSAPFPAGPCTLAPIPDHAPPPGERSLRSRGLVVSPAPEAPPPPARHRIRLRRGDALMMVPGRPLVMGILNVTPDSFHDGDPSAVLRDRIEQGLTMVEEGADLIDVGGESTRPGAPPVPPEEEIRRVAPVIRALRSAGVEVPISIDTSKASVAAAALAEGADLVNDVTGLAGDPEMAAQVARSRVPAVLMHMRGTPETMRDQAVYRRWPPAEIAWELRERMAAARAVGVTETRMLLDPGIGFAKDWRQSLEVLRRLDVLVGLGRPVLVGASRKSLLCHAAGTGPESEERLPGSLVLAVEAARRGASMVRVHDVSETVQALRTLTAVEDGLRARPQPLG